MHQDLVYLIQNGTLMFYPFTSEQYRPEIHSAVYRCKLKNLVGAVISREVHVKAGKLNIFVEC
uniref:CSON009256 protein n=1 Tax=Culicoides sonorensis TaxID=179676 RepID=A0A336M0H3_CULSO